MPNNYRSSRTRRAIVALPEPKAGDLGRFSDAIQYAIQDLYHPDAWVRKEAAFTIQAAGAKEAAPYLIGLLKDPQFEVRDRASIALGELGNPAAVPALVEFAKDAHQDRLRANALTALGKIGHPDGIPVILSALDGNDDGLKIEAAESARHFNDNRIIRHLAKALMADHSTVRVNAAKSLGHIGNPKAARALSRGIRKNPIFAGPYRSADFMVDALLKLRRTGREQLTRMVRHSDRLIAAPILERIWHRMGSDRDVRQDAGKVALAGLAHKDSIVRLQAVRVLALEPNPGTARHLVEAFRRAKSAHGHDDVFAQAFRALAKTPKVAGEPRAMMAVRTAMRYADPATHPRAFLRLLADAKNRAYESKPPGWWAHHALTLKAQEGRLKAE